MPTIFPTTKLSLHMYLSVNRDYLNTNAERLQILPEYITQLNALYGDAETIDTYEYYYVLWCDKGNTRTKNVVANLLTKETELKNLLRNIYNDIPDRLWTTEDRLSLNRKTGLPRTVTHHQTQITEPCNSYAEVLTGGELKICCHSLPDQTHSSMNIQANAVEIAYRINHVQIDPGDGHRFYPQIQHFNDGTTKAIHTRSKFIMKLGVENAGSQFQYYMRWTLIRNPQLAGPWTGPFTCIIA
jgi:hypothetical protein